MSAPTRECQRMADDSQDDVVLEIDGVTIGSDQTVALRRLERIEFQYLISSKTTDHVCTVTIIRCGVRQVVHIPLKPELSLIPVSTSSPNCAPSYLIVGGLVFVPLSRPWIVSSKKNALVLQQVRLPPPLPLWAHIGVGILHTHTAHTHNTHAQRAQTVGRGPTRSCGVGREKALASSTESRQSSATLSHVVRCKPRACRVYAACMLYVACRLCSCAKRPSSKRAATSSLWCSAQCWHTTLTMASIRVGRTSPSM